MSYRIASIKETIQATVGSLGRLALIGTTAFGIASYANFGHHKSYWNGTIERVQTVDFNMLSHMLPTKLSQSLMAGNAQEIQRTLDSNYGLFGLVVTNCRTSQPDCRQDIQYVSDSKLPWREGLSNEMLSASTYDVLRDPPPAYTIGSYASSREPVRQPTGSINSGRIIGRVYYVRGIPPSFLSAYSKWIKAWPASFTSESGSNRYYSLTTVLFGLGGLSAWMFMERHLAESRKHIVESNRQKEQLELSATKAVEEAQSWRQQLVEKRAENAGLIEQRNQHLAELDASKHRYEHQEAELRDSLQVVESRLANQTQAYEAEKQRQSDLQASMQEHQHSVDLLNQEIADLRSQDVEGARDKQLTAEKIAHLVKEQADKQTQVERHANELEQVWQELKLQTEEKEEKAKLAEILSEQIKESKRQQASASSQSIELQSSLRLIEEERESDKRKIQSLETKLRDEKNQGDALRAVVDDITQSSLNLFEGKIVSELKKTAKVKSSVWSIHTQLDMGLRNRTSASMVADCVVVGSSFIAVIEAKQYAGKIYADGDSRNAVWLCAEERRNPIKIASCWGDNPYKQVTAYVHGAMALLKRNAAFRQKNICKEVSIYGVVVFPDTADLSLLDTDLGKYYRVAKLGELADVLHQLERQAQQIPTKKGEKSLVAAEIEESLYGRYSAKPRLKSAA
ncbi:MAG: NERD domain-containing protein [Phormidesmis sp.]